jgi:hypothetical protein
MAWAIDHRTDPLAIHVVPMDDLRDHVCSRSCWCRPVDTDADDIDIEQAATRPVFVHRPMDERDSYIRDGGTRQTH